jgi:hypothetical protein
MTTQEVAKKLVDLCSLGKFTEAHDSVRRGRSADVAVVAAVQPGNRAIHLIDPRSDSDVAQTRRCHCGTTFVSKLV